MGKFCRQTENFTPRGSDQTLTQEVRTAMLCIVLSLFHAHIVKQLVAKQLRLNSEKWWASFTKCRAVIPVDVSYCCFKAKCVIAQRNKSQISSNSSQKAISSLYERKQKLVSWSYKLKQKTAQLSLPIRTFWRLLLLATHLQNNDQQQCWLLSDFFRFHASQILLDRCPDKIWYRAVFFVRQRLQFFLRLRIHYCFNLLS